MSICSALNKAVRASTAIATDRRGSVAVEAAIAFPVLLLMIFSFISMVQLLSVRSLVYDELVFESRHLSVTELKCGGTEVVDQAKADSKTRIIDGLAARGIQLPAGDVQIVPDQSLPDQVTRWNISAQFISQCGACQTLQGIIPFRGIFSVNIASFRDGKGCI